MKYIHFVGIDVAKESLDICLSKGNEIVSQLRIENSPKQISSLLKELRKHPEFLLATTLFCMEHTGIYNNHLLDTLHKNKCSLWLESAMQIKLSLGLQRGKSDKVDATRIAKYAYKNREVCKIWEPPREIITQLKNLLSLRDRLVATKKQLVQPLNENKNFVSKQNTKEHQKLIGKVVNETISAIKKTESSIDGVIRKDEYLNNLFNLITSVQGIGKIIATNVIIRTNEFKNINDPKKFACFIGVAPFEHSSGTSIRGRTRISHIANKDLKTLFHLGAVVTLKLPGDLREYYERKVEEGKHKMNVINAIRNKLVHRVFAVVKRGTPYTKTKPVLGLNCSNVCSNLVN